MKPNFYILVLYCILLLPLLFKENVKYAIRLRNYGSRTANGDGGMTTVQCPDGVTFTFSTCSLSSNGTNQTRGQIPQILYYRFVCSHDVFLRKVNKTICAIIPHLFREVTEINTSEVCLRKGSLAAVLCSFSVVSVLGYLVKTAFGAPVVQSCIRFSYF